MDERRIIGRAPNLELEIRHKNAPAEGAEYLALTLRAAPDLASVAALLDPFGVVRWLAAANPFMALMVAANPFLAPLLPGPTAPAAATPSRPVIECDELSPPANQLH